MRINGQAVEPIDPLFLHMQRAVTDASDGDEPLVSHAQLFGEPLVYEVQAPSTSPHPEQIGLVTVTFTELPVHAWHGLTNKEKRQLGISKGAGVSIVRGNREVDYGWHFLHSKRRENYDDWWRCEIRFDPVLDEAFGITHTKQQARPMEYLSTLLCADMETIARALNSRVRREHLKLKTAERFSKIEDLVQGKDSLLRPIASIPSEQETSALLGLRARHPALEKDKTRPYKLVEDSITSERDGAFFDLARDEEQLVVVINPDIHSIRRCMLPSRWIRPPVLPLCADRSSCYC